MWFFTHVVEMMSSKCSEPSLTGISSGQSPLELMGQHRPSARLNTAQHCITQPITSQANVMSWCNCCLEVYSPGAQKWTPGWCTRNTCQPNICLFTWFRKYIVVTLIIMINNGRSSWVNICATSTFVSINMLMNLKYTWSWVHDPVSTLLCLTEEIKMIIIHVKGQHETE